METAVAQDAGNLNEIAYREYIDRVQSRFLAVTKMGARALFRTSVEDLFHTYIDSFPANERQHYNCNTCHHFLRRFGSLVVINEDGSTTSAVWDVEDAIGTEYAGVVAQLVAAVERAKVDGPLFSNEVNLGVPITGRWRHLALPNPTVFKHAMLSPEQFAAEKREDFKNIMRALDEFDVPALDTALKLLETDSLYRSEAVLGPVQFLRTLHASIAPHTGSRRRNLVWRAVAAAPAGFCHPRSSMAGTLLADIAAGKGYDEVARSFASKMHPLKYQRPQAAPSVGTIAQAEKLFEQMGLAPALKRRFARIEEVSFLWAPSVAPEAPKPADGKVFGHLQPKGAAPLPDMAMPPVVITWDKFARTVLPTAQEIECLVVGRHFIVILTAEDPAAPPILQWDSLEARNPFSWYVWSGGAPPSAYGFGPREWVKVPGITRLPTRWGDDDGKFAHQGDGVIVLLAGAKELKAPQLGLFPSLLRSELHGARHVIEAHSQGATPSGKEEGTAIGYDLRAGAFQPTTLRVKTSERTVDYTVDRWD